MNISPSGKFWPIFENRLFKGHFGSISPTPQNQNPMAPWLKFRVSQALNVLDSSYIKARGVRWPCLEKYFWFLVTPQRWSTLPQALVHKIICLHIKITLWSFVIVSFTRPRSLGWLDDCVGKSPKRRLVGGTGTYNKSDGDDIYLMIKCMCLPVCLLLHSWELYQD